MMKQKMDTDSVERVVLSKIGVEIEAGEKIADKFDTVNEFLAFLTRDEDVTQFDGIGNRTAVKVDEWFKSNHPELQQQRKQNSDRICLTFTDSVGDSERGDSGSWAFICPQCNGESVMSGDVSEFKNRSTRCTHCNSFSLLDGDALEEYFSL